jgi:hypothetical protein
MHREKLSALRPLCVLCVSAVNLQISNSAA